MTKNTVSKKFLTLLTGAMLAVAAPAVMAQASGGAGGGSGGAAGTSDSDGGGNQGAKSNEIGGRANDPSRSTQDSNVVDKPMTKEEIKSKKQLPATSGNGTNRQ